MFDVGPDNNLILAILFLLAFMITIIVFFVTKKKLLPTILVISILSNWILYEDVSVLSYNKWFIFFILDYWPIINIALLLFIIVRYFKKIKSKNNG